uniref:keratin, type II cytoskeletal 1-like n=1 Tax=Erigeron canadensis TaxID=72917 RepID=UPI001CB930AB|nr:keratin, type II cytoskeletal 1-like [Erigeron canadensis]
MLDGMSQVIKSFLVVLIRTLEENNVYTLDGKALAFGVQVNDARVRGVCGNKRVQLEVELPKVGHELKNDQGGRVKQKASQGRQDQLALNRRGKQVVTFTRSRKTSIDVAACDVEKAEGELAIKASDTSEEVMVHQAKVINPIGRRGGGGGGRGGGGGGHGGGGSSGRGGGGSGSGRGGGVGGSKGSGEDHGGFVGTMGGHHGTTGNHSGRRNKSDRNSPTFVPLVSTLILALVFLI